MLTLRLRELESEGLVERRTVENRFPRKSEYRLTESSKDLISVLYELKHWSLKWRKYDSKCANQLCSHCTH